jgi:hypothetical protein
MLKYNTNGEDLKTLGEGEQAGVKLDSQAHSHTWLVISPVLRRTHNTQNRSYADRIANNQLHLVGEGSTPGVSKT